MRDRLLAVADFPDLCERTVLWSPISRHAYKNGHFSMLSPFEFTGTPIAERGTPAVRISRATPFVRPVRCRAQEFVRGASGRHRHVRWRTRD